MSRNKNLQKLATNLVDPEDIYSKLERIGKGSFGSVYKGVDKKSSKMVAIKIIEIDTEEDDISEIQAEIQMLSRCDCENIVKYYGSFLQRTTSNLWIIMDFCGAGSIRKLLRPGPFEEKYVQVIAREVLQGLRYLHESKIIHRDVKAANILLTDKGEVKLCDFGVSGQLSMTTMGRNSFVGTPYWMAPEVITRSKYDYKADIWSFGITLYEIATGHPPLVHVEPLQVLHLIPHSGSPILEGNYSKSLKQLVSNCLSVNPHLRSSAEELLKKPFIKGAKKGVSVLMDVIQRYERWKEGDSDSEEVKESNDAEDDGQPEEDQWIFDSLPTNQTNNQPVHGFNGSLNSSKSGLDGMEQVDQLMSELMNEKGKEKEEKEKEKEKEKQLKEFSEHDEFDQDLTLTKPAAALIQIPQTLSPQSLQVPEMTQGSTSAPNSPKFSSIKSIPSRLSNKSSPEVNKPDETESEERFGHFPTESSAPRLPHKSHLRLISAETGKEFNRSISSSHLMYHREQPDESQLSPIKFHAKKSISIDASLGDISIPSDMEMSEYDTASPVVSPVKQSPSRSNSLSNGLRGPIPKQKENRSQSDSSIHFPQVSRAPSQSPLRKISDPGELSTLSSSPSFDWLQDRGRLRSLHMNKDEVINELTLVAQETFELLDHFDSALKDFAGID